jgi:hypothetical protein
MNTLANGNYKLVGVSVGRVLYKWVYEDSAPPSNYRFVVIKGDVVERIKPTGNWDGKSEQEVPDIEKGNYETWDEYKFSDWDDLNKHLIKDIPWI